MQRLEKLERELGILDRRDVEVGQEHDVVGRFQRFQRAVVEVGLAVDDDMLERLAQDLQRQFYVLGVDEVGKFRAARTGQYAHFPGHLRHQAADERRVDIGIAARDVDDGARRVQAQQHLEVAELEVEVDKRNVLARLPGQFEGDVYGQDRLADSSFAAEQESDHAVAVPAGQRGRRRGCRRRGRRGCGRRFSSYRLLCRRRRSRRWGRGSLYRWRGRSCGLQRRDVLYGRQHCLARSCGESCGDVATRQLGRHRGGDVGRHRLGWLQHRARRRRAGRRWQRRLERGRSGTRCGLRLRGLRRLTLELAHAPDRAGQLVGREWLHQVFARPGLHGAAQVLAVVLHRDHHHWNRRQLGREQLGRPDPVHVGEVDVHEDQVGKQAPSFLQAGGRRGGGRHHLDVRLHGQELLQVLQGARRVIDYDDPDRARHALGRLRLGRQLREPVPLVDQRRPDALRRVDVGAGRYRGHVLRLVILERLQLVAERRLGAKPVQEL